jgi:hypothetical protein
MIQKIEKKRFHVLLFKAMDEIDYYFGDCFLPRRAVCELHLPKGLFP